MTISHPIFGTIISQRTAQGVVVANVGRHINTVQHHVRHSEHVRQWLLFHPVEGILQGFAILSGFKLWLEMLDRVGQKAARTAGRVKHFFAQLGVDDIDHKLGHSTGGVIFTRIPRRLQIRQNFFVDIVKQMAIGRRVEIDIRFNTVNYLTQQRARLHVVVGIFKHLTHYPCPGAKSQPP